MMDEQEVAGALQKIKTHAAAIDAEADALLAAMEGEPPPVEPPDHGPDPGPGNPGEWIGGDVGSGKRKVIEGKVYTSPIKPAADTDYYKCVFKTGTARVIDNYKVPRNVRMLDCTFDGCKADHVLYFNNGHAEDEIDFVLQRATLLRCQTPNFAEFKASLIWVADCEQGEGCKIGQTLRQRHGRKLSVLRCQGFSEISARGWLHFVKDCPGADVRMWAGNLPARYEDWGAGPNPPHKPGGGFNMQCSELCYAEGVGSVEVGHVQGEGAKSYPALNCMTHPDQRSVKLSCQDGYKKQAIDNPAALWAMGR